MLSLRSLKIIRAARVIAMLAFSPSGAIAQDQPPLPQAPHGAVFAKTPDGADDLYLEVSINRRPANRIVLFRRLTPDCLTISKADLLELRLKPPPALARRDDRVCLEQLPGFSYDYDASAQAISLSPPEASRETMILNRPSETENLEHGTQNPDLSMITNYSLFANFGGEDIGRDFRYDGVSASLDSHIFSHSGVFDQSAIVRSQPASGDSMLRLDTRWSREDPDQLINYAAGDVISGSLTWTRPIRLGGAQIKRNFALRPDLITMPAPEVSGSAAVPSTVEVFANKRRAFSGTTADGPFTVSNVPVVSGPGVINLVVRDAAGRETSKEYRYYASPLLLAPGLLDYSVETGFARTFYGVQSDAYDENLLASGSVRYGLTPQLTIEGHAETGAGVFNGGVGAALGLSSIAVASLAASASVGTETGGQAHASVESSFWGIRVYGRTSMSFGDYQDLASATAPASKSADEILPYSSSQAPYRRQSQIAVSIPLGFDASSLNLSFIDAEAVSGDGYAIGAISYSRAVWGNASLSLNAYRDFDEPDAYGLYLGLSFGLNGVSYGSSLETAGRGYSAGVYASRPAEPRAGGYGYSVRAYEGSAPNSAASFSYRARGARLEAGLQKTANSAQVTASADGAVAFLDGAYFADRIGDSFAVVDTGIPNVAVQHENHAIGKTGADGKIIIPGIRAHERNTVSIDPLTLPLDAEIERTEITLTPKVRGGLSVHFKSDAIPASALVSLTDERGRPVATGSEVSLNGAPPVATVGYDGEVFLTGLQPSNTATLTKPDGSTCAARFPFSVKAGHQVRIENVECK